MKNTLAFLLLLSVNSNLYSQEGQLNRKIMISVNCSKFPFEGFSKRNDILGSFEEGYVFNVSNFYKVIASVGVGTYEIKISKKNELISYFPIKLQQQLLKTGEMTPSIGVNFNFGLAYQFNKNYDLGLAGIVGTALTIGRTSHIKVMWDRFLVKLNDQKSLYKDVFSFGTSFYI